MKNIQNFLDGKIWNVLMKLEKQSTLEKNDEVDVLPNEKMLAISKDTGMFFNIMLKSMNVERILEIGTSVGYSTLWFSDAVKQNLPNSGNKLIITIDENHSKIERAQKNFRDAGVDDIIETRDGYSLNVLHNLVEEYEKNNNEPKFDFVFIDADKENLIKYYEMVFPLVRIGGIIAVDNMLFPERYRPIMKKYADYVRAKSNVQSVTLPIGNGEEITIKTN